MLIALHNSTNSHSEPGCHQCPKTLATTRSTGLTASDLCQGRELALVGAECVSVGGRWSCLEGTFNWAEAVQDVHEVTDPSDIPGTV